VDTGCGGHPNLGISIVVKPPMRILQLGHKMQMSFAKKSGTVKDGSGGDSGLGSGSKGDSSPKARVSHDPSNR
jgi:hypothetical protein